VSRDPLADRARIIISRMCHFLGGRSLEALRELADTGVPDDLRVDSPELRAAIRDEATRQLYEDPS
jgi:hypothetical protein